MAMSAYAAGGAALAAIGPALWQVPAHIAAIAASATTLVFMAAHSLVDARHAARAAMAEARQRRRELVALGKYVARVDARLVALSETADAATVAAEPVPAPLPEPVRTYAPSATAEVPVTDNLLQFAAKFSAARTAPAASQDACRDIADAIAGAQMELQLQPIARLAGKQTAHFRAIARLRDGAGGYHPAAAVEQAVKALSLSAEFETQQLACVVSLCNRIGDRHAGARIFCALSGEALRSDAFRAELTGFMESHPELARRLVFEMDLATVLALNAEAVGDLRALEDIGFAFAVADASMQDLGRAFNAFGRLAYARIEAAKLAGVDPNIVHALAKAGTQILATGVADETVSAELAAAGVTYAEGPLFGGPRRAKMEPGPQRMAA